MLQPQFNQMELPTSEAVASINDWVPINKFCDLFPHIPEKTIRWQLTSRSTNGLEPYVQVIGKQRYISIKGYALWLEQHAGIINQATTG
ncbi:MAG: hypothetical protein V7699_01630 [Porticoccus sp.]